MDGIDLINYVDESQLEDVMRLVGQDLSEPYSSKAHMNRYCFLISRVLLDEFQSLTLSKSPPLFHYSIHISVLFTSMARAVHPSGPRQ